MGKCCIIHNSLLKKKKNTAPPKSASATISSHQNYSTFKHSHLFCVNDWNHNNKYNSLSHSRAPVKDKSQSYVTGHSSPQLGTKRTPHMAPDNITETTQLVSLVQKTAAQYLPPTILNYFHSQGDTENDSFQPPGTNRHNKSPDASSRQDAPSPLNQWSSLSQEKNPIYSKFTLGLSPSMFHSFLFPQQVMYEKHKTSHASSHSLKYSNVKREDFKTRIRSSPSTYDKPEYASTTIRSSTSSHDESEDPDSSFGSTTSSYDDNKDPGTFRLSPISSCDEEDTSFSPTARYHVDSAAMFGDLSHTPSPPTPPVHRERNMKKVVRRPPGHSAERSRQNYMPGYTKNQIHSMFEVHQRETKYQKNILRDTPRKAKPETGVIISPYGDGSSRTTPKPPSSSSQHVRPYGGIKPPLFTLGTDFGEDAPTCGKVKTLTSSQFHHFITEKKFAAVMFYDGTDAPKDILKVWEREANEKDPTGERNYGFVDCANDPTLCQLQNIPTSPFYKMYIDGYSVASGHHYKMLTRDAR